MITSHKRRRVAALSASATVALALVIGGANALAAPNRSAAVAVDSTYLADTLGLPTDTVVETVTYDRFQWLLQQPGQYAFVIGSAADPGFPAKVVSADAAAKAAGAAKIYWYDPNLTGQTGIRNLNTRVPSGINLAPASQEFYGNTWRSLLAQYLGNGLKATVTGQETKVSVAADDTVVNDSVDPVWDVRSSATPAVTATDDVFFVYDKDATTNGVPDKIVSWVNLSSVSDANGAVASALAAAGGGAVVDQLGQFEWWKSSANRKHDLSYPNDLINGGDIITDADGVDGWRVKQITYPELLHLLDIKETASTNFVLLFGGTWCHNTRAVIKDVNAEAQANGIHTVYNFDLVLDGGTTNGTNQGANPIHVRDNANSGSTFNFRPSWVYGDVVRTYFRNLVTEYDPNAGNRVAYYSKADLTVFPDVVRKLQVPFLINYQRGTGSQPSTTAVKRQWIQQNTDASTGLPTFKEYMSEWWFTHPSPQLGLSFPIPADESGLSPAQQSQLTTARLNLAFGQEAIAKLRVFFGGLPGSVASTQSIQAPSVDSETAPQVTLSIDNTYGRQATGSATLAVDGLNYPVAIAENKAVFVLPKFAAGTYPFTVTYPGDSNVVGFTVAGNLTITQAASTPTNPTASASPSPSASPSATASPSPAPTATPSPSVQPSATPAPTTPPVGPQTPVYSGTEPEVRTITKTVRETRTVYVTPAPSPAPSLEPSPEPSVSAAAEDPSEPSEEPSAIASAEPSATPEPGPVQQADASGSGGGSDALTTVAVVGALIGATGLSLGGIALWRRRGL